MPFNQSTNTQVNPSQDQTKYTTYCNTDTFYERLNQIKAKSGNSAKGPDDVFLSEGCYPPAKDKKVNSNTSVNNSQQK
jgi:hypothetical protein